jgi:hypothetical protein
MTEVITNKTNLENTNGFREFYAALDARLTAIEIKLGLK